MIGWRYKSCIPASMQEEGAPLAAILRANAVGRTECAKQTAGHVRRLACQQPVIGSLQHTAQCTWPACLATSLHQLPEIGRRRRIGIDQPKESIRLDCFAQVRVEQLAAERAAIEAIMQHVLSLEAGKGDLEGSIWKSRRIHCC
jgi:hypothetical protein